METISYKNYLKLYIKYKTKYLYLKSKKIQVGGNQDLVSNYLQTLNNLVDQIEQLLNKIKEKDSNFKLIRLNWYEINQNPDLMNLNSLVDKLQKFLELDDIPLVLNDYPYSNLEELDNSINVFRSGLSLNNLIEKYKLREQIYKLDMSNYLEILDLMIVEFNIVKPSDIEKIFESTILGYNKNHIIGYMVLFRFLIKNNIQLTTIDNNISFLTSKSIFSLLNYSLNNEEYIEILMELINNYIKSFPIKKIIQIRNPPEIEKLFGFKDSQLFGEINEKIEFIDSYDAKNKVIIYKSGLVKDAKKTNFDDVKQIINTLFRIPVKTFV
jgi:hypothetical protein